VTRTHAQARVVALEECDGETLAAAPLQEAVGVLEVEADADDAGDGRERDVAFAKRSEHAELAVTAALDDAGGADEGGGVGARVRSRQPEARDQRPVSQTRQEVCLLRVGSVPHEEFAGAERVGDCDSGVGVEAVGAELGEDARDRVR